MTGKIRPGFIDEDRYDRSRRIAWLDMEAVQRTKCLVVGVGALSNEVVKDLVLSGIKDITIVDMDQVVRSNLNRCIFFREGDAERSLAKVDVVARRAKELASDIRISTHEGRVEDMVTEELGHFDVILGCLDNIAARLHINAHACHLKVPYIDGGTDGFRGKVQVVLPPATPCLQCAMNQSHQRILERRFSCTGAEVVVHERKVAAEITTSSIIAAMQVREALKVISGRSEACIRHVEYYDGYQVRSESYELELAPDCPNHG
jgi:molybdopterin/thiamine biosynthesis adenylyltransferase